MDSRDGERGAAPLSCSAITFDPEKISRGLGTVVFPPVTQEGLATRPMFIGELYH